MERPSSDPKDVAEALRGEAERHGDVTPPPLTLSPRLYDKLTQRRPMPLRANIHRGK